MQSLHVSGDPTGTAAWRYDSAEGAFGRYSGRPDGPILYSSPITSISRPYQGAATKMEKNASFRLNTCETPNYFGMRRPHAG